MTATCFDQNRSQKTLAKPEPSTNDSDEDAVNQHVAA